MKVIIRCQPMALIDGLLAFDPDVSGPDNIPEKAIRHGCQNPLHLENHVLNSFQDYTAQYLGIIARFGMKIQSSKYQYFRINGRL